MHIAVIEQIHLSEFLPTDQDALVAHLNDREVYERTLHIPFPYAAKNADDWLAHVAKVTEHQGKPVHFAIRLADGRLIGGCGFDDIQIGQSHRAEIGYWLARP